MMRMRNEDDKEGDDEDEASFFPRNVRQQLVEKEPNSTYPKKHKNTKTMKLVFGS